jgi:hypothetical protein
MKPLKIDDHTAELLLIDLKNYIERSARTDDWKYFDPKQWESLEEHHWIFEAYIGALKHILDAMNKGTKLD